MTPERIKTSGFVLRCLNYSESDLIVTFYSLDFGKCKGIAKGAKRSKKRFANVFEPFSHISIIFSHRKSDSLAFIESCEIIEHYPGIRGNLEKTLTASYFIDITDRFSPEGKKNANIFDLLNNFLLLMEKENLSAGIVRFFEMKLLKLAGFEPVLDRCIKCKTPVTNGAYYFFYPTDGGIKCSTCARPEIYEQPISPETMRTLLLGKDMDLDKIKLLAMSDTVAQECRNILIGFITHVLGREINSLKIMEQVQKM